MKPVPLIRVALRLGIASLIAFLAWVFACGFFPEPHSASDSSDLFFITLLAFVAGGGIATWIEPK